MDIALIGNHNIHRILVDTGATFNLMYYSTLMATGLAQDHLVTSNTTLVSFSGERARALRVIKLSITKGTTPQQVTIMDEFLVLDNPCTYNAILRRGALNEIKFVMSTYIL